MDIEKLVRMANQIGTHFAVEADRDTALANIAQHLASFWAPAMRQTLLNHLDQTGGGGLAPLVCDALRQDRQRLAGRHIQHQPIQQVSKP